MNPGFNLEEEIYKVDYKLAGKEIISTIDLALVFNLCNEFIKNKLGQDIISIYENSHCTPDDVTRFIMLTIYSDQRLVNFLEKYCLYSSLATTIFSMLDKKIITITEPVIENSNKVPEQMPRHIDSSQVRRIFSALRRNYDLYNKIYKDKIWIVNSTDMDGNLIKSGRIRITPYAFFHLMGFDYNKINPRKKDDDGTSHEAYAREFAELFPNPQKAYDLISNFGEKKNQLELLSQLIERESRFLELADAGRLGHTVNADKLEMKGYAFERMGYIETASGMVIFDMAKAIQLGYGDKLKHSNPDIILLNDFIRKYKLTELFGLDFVISPFKKLKGNNPSDQQSIYLTGDPRGGLYAGVLDQQKASITSSAVGYRENDFNYTIREEDGDSVPIKDPVDFREFPIEERQRVAQTLIEAHPELDRTYLDGLVNGESNSR